MGGVTYVVRGRVQQLNRHGIYVIYTRVRGFRVHQLSFGRRAHAQRYIYVCVRNGSFGRLFGSSSGFGKDVIAKQISNPYICIYENLYTCSY